MEEGAGMKGGSGNGKRAGMKRGREWKSGEGMRDIADCLTLRRLRGGVKIRASEFLGGGGMPPIIVISPPPATASRSHPPPQAAEGKNSFLSKKEFPFPRKRESPYPLIVKNDAVRALLAPANREIPAFAGMEGGAGMEGEGGNGRGGGNEKRSGNGRGEWESY